MKKHPTRHSKRGKTESRETSLLKLSLLFTLMHQIFGRIDSHRNPFLFDKTFFNEERIRMAAQSREKAEKEYPIVIPEGMLGNSNQGSASDRNRGEASEGNSDLYLKLVNRQTPFNNRRLT